MWLIALSAAVVCDFGTQPTRRAGAAMFLLFAVVFGVLFLISRRRRFAAEGAAMWKLGQCGLSMASGLACFVASTGVWFK